MRRKIKKIEKMRDDAGSLVASRKGEVTCDPVEVESRLTEEVLNRVLKILKEEEDASYISKTYELEENICNSLFAGDDVRMRYNR